MDTAIEFDFDKDTGEIKNKADITDILKGIYRMVAVKNYNPAPLLKDIRCLFFVCDRFDPNHTMRDKSFEHAFICLYVDANNPCQIMTRIYNLNIKNTRLSHTF